MGRGAGSVKGGRAAGSVKREAGKWISDLRFGPSTRLWLAQGGAARQFQIGVGVGGDFSILLQFRNWRSMALTAQSI